MDNPKPDMFTQPGGLLIETQISTQDSLPGLMTSSSDLSAMTIETDSISPASTAPKHQLETADYRVTLADSSDDHLSTDGSFTSTEGTVLNKSSKRTASGALKHSYSTIPSMSKDQSALEVSQLNLQSKKHVFNVQKMSTQLKTRLKYAMLKIQNGWESQSLDQIESMSPTIPDSPISRWSRRPSNASDAYLMSPMDHSNHVRFASRDLPSGSASALMAVTGVSSNYLPSLAPAALIDTRREKRRSLNGRAPPNLPRSNDTPHSPVTPRAAVSAGTARSMMSNQAEKDAIDTLLFMSSPNNSKTLKHRGPRIPTNPHQSPRTTPKSSSRIKKVDFEIPKPPSRR
jgi:hypothetical protein